MMNRRPARHDGQRCFKLQVPAANGKVGADALDARRAWLASFWALVLQRFRDHAHGSGDPATRRARHDEEDT
jgi:hypothetical protein